MKKLWLIAIGIIGLTVPAWSDPVSAPGDYGFCAHFQRWEYPNHKREMDLMKECGATWVRFDFDWGDIEKQPGVYDLKKYDEIVDDARARNLNILGILVGLRDMKRFQVPYQHQKELFAYIRACVERYKGRVDHWEFMNEVDLAHEWGEKPDPVKYAELLGEAAKVIREANPKAVVVHSGLAGVPVPIYEQELKTGMISSCDAINIHPYTWSLPDKDEPELVQPKRLDQLNALLAKYPKRELWVTETGNATGANESPLFRRFFVKAMELCNIDPAQCEAVVIVDPMEQYFSDDAFPESLKQFRAVRAVTLAQVAGLDPKSSPLLILRPGENFPKDKTDLLLPYLKNGGTVLMCGGFPFYCERECRNGESITKQVGDRYMEKFHLGWDAWWTNKNVPQHMERVEPENPFPKGNTPWWIDRWTDDMIPPDKRRVEPGKPLDGFAEKAGGHTIGRAITTRNLHPGDEMIPLVYYVDKDGKRYPVAGVYRLRSELKGNFIVNLAPELNSQENSTEDTQARLVGRNGLLLLGHGVDKYFVYKFGSYGASPYREHHFGMVRRDLSPKPAFYAYQTLTRMRPDGSSKVILSPDGNFYSAEWQRPDGKYGYAFWSFGRRKYRLTLEKEVQVDEIADYLGKSIDPKLRVLPVDGGITFVIAPQKLKFTVQSADALKTL